MPEIKILFLKGLGVEVWSFGGEKTLNVCLNVYHTPLKSCPGAQSKTRDQETVLGPHNEGAGGSWVWRWWGGHAPTVDYMGCTSRTTGCLLKKE